MDGWPCLVDGNVHGNAVVLCDYDVDLHLFHHIREASFVEEI